MYSARSASESSLYASARHAATVRTSSSGSDSTVATIASSGGDGGGDLDTLLRMYGTRRLVLATWLCERNLRGVILGDLERSRLRCGGEALSRLCKP